MKKKSARVGVVGRLLLRLEPRRVAAGGGLYTRMMASSSEVNDKFWVRNFNGGRKIHQILAQGLWPNTFRLDCTVLGKSIGLVTRQNSWEAYMGRPMEQTVPDTCALVACTVCMEAMHRLQHEKLAGDGPFLPRAVAPYNLLIACLRDRIWMPSQGANVGAVLTKIQEMGGVPATTNTQPAPAPSVLLPLRSWQKHRWDAAGDPGTRRLSPERVAALLDSHGPCVGVLWVCPWYFEFHAGVDDALVYRGCGRSEDDRRESWRLYSSNGVVGSHAVVCFAYRFCGDNQMHVLVRDNHDGAANGPQRWVDVEELDTIYTLTVE